MERKPYNGWTNYHTWLVNLWESELLHDIAAQYVESHKDNLTSTDYMQHIDAEQAIEDVREQYKDWFYEHVYPKVYGLAADLMAHTEIDWYTLAETHLEDALTEAGIAIAVLEEQD